MLTFNITTSRNKFERLNNLTFQIMPTRTGLLNPYKFDQIQNQKTNIVLHTGYDFHPFQFSLFDVNSYTVQQLKSYLDTCRRLHVDQLLIHGPDQPKYLKYFDSTLTILRAYLDDFNSQNPSPLQICIEMPVFCKSMYVRDSEFVGINPNNVYDFVLSYFNTVIKFGFDIVIDTAHLFGNGLTTNQMIEVMEIFKNNYKYIHLNGNCRPQYSHDKHTTLTPCHNYPSNLIPDVQKLLLKVKELMDLGKICISEQKCNSREYFIELSKQYGFKLNSELINNPDLII